MMIQVHWCLFAALIGFSMVGVITLVLQFVFAYWCGTNQYDKFK